MSLIWLSVQVTRAEFHNKLLRAAKADPKPLMSRDESNALFDWYDTDGSGAVGMKELVEMIAAFKQTDSSTLNQAKIKEVWDADGDGMVRLLTACFLS